MSRFPNPEDQDESIEERLERLEAAAATPPPDPVSDEEKAILGQRQSLATGADGGSAPLPEDPYQAASRAFDVTYASRGRTAATDEAFASLRKSAERGDRRATYDPDRPLKRYGV